MTFYGYFQNGNLVGCHTVPKWCLNGELVTGTLLPPRPSLRHKWQGDETGQWIDPGPSPEDQVAAARTAAAELWRSQPVATRAKYGTLYTTIVDAFDRSDAEAALYILNGASVDAEEAALKGQFLALFGL